VNIGIVDFIVTENLDKKNERENAIVQNLRLSKNRIPTLTQDLWSQSQWPIDCGYAGGGRDSRDRFNVGFLDLDRYRTLDQ
jgi:hypothetical protein